MARTEARIYTEIWEDPDFLALNPSAQRMFLFLVSQKDLAHDGVIALRERRWSKAAASLTPDGVSRDLKELAATRFVVIDEDTEELLVRSFIRRDKVYRQPNVLRAAADHLPLVSSRAIRAEIHAELARVIEAGGFVEASGKILDEMLAETGKGLGNPTRNPPEKGSDIPPENPTGLLPGEWGVVTGVTTEFPVPRSSESPDPGTPPASTSSNRQATAAAAGPDRFDEFWSVFPRKEGKGAAKAKYAIALRKTTAQALIDAAGKFRDRMRGKDPQYVAMPATWLHQERWTDEPATGTPSPPGKPDGRRVSSDFNGYADLMRKRDAS